MPAFGPVHDFYGALGFTLIREEDDYLVMRRGDGGDSIAFWGGSRKVLDHSYFERFPSDSPRGFGVEIIVVVEDLDSVYRTAIERGWVNEPLRDRPWGLRDFRTADPFGFYLRFTEPYLPADPRAKE